MAEAVAYYNEPDPYCAQWLRNLIDAGHIAPGDVDERDIRDIRPDDVAGYTQCHFFAGIGVWSYALRLAGWPDDRPVWTGSCPCQPFSKTGRGGGFTDERHLWPAWHHLIKICRPGVVFGEQVAEKSGLQWIDLVQADLEGTGYALGAADMCAAGVGAPHVRQRLWFVADTDDAGLEGRQGGSVRRQDQRSAWSNCVATRGLDGKLWWSEPGAFPLAHGAPARVGRLRAYGNAIVAPLAAEFVSAYMEACDA
jgi:DNA (cytosine-5)-methyltransferase 1